MASEVKPNETGRRRQQNPEGVQSWQDTEYPEIANRVKKEGALID